MDQVIELVFFGEKSLRVRIGNAVLTYRKADAADIPPRAEGFLSRSLQENGNDAIIVRPPTHGGQQQLDHVETQGIQGALTVQRGDGEHATIGQRALFQKNDRSFGHGGIPE